MLRQNERYQERSLVLKEQTVNALTKLHGESVVSREDFLKKQTESLNLLRGLGYEIMEVQKEISNNTDAVNLGNLIAMRGHQQTHEDLVEIAGDVQNIEKAIHKSTRKIHGAEYPQLSISSIVSDSQSFFNALSAYTKGFFTQDTCREFENLVNERLGSDRLESQIRTKLERNLEKKRSLLKREELLAELSAIESAAYLIECPSLLIWDPEEGYKKFKTLSNYANQYSIPELNNFLEEARELIVLSEKACITPVAKGVMITYANEGLLTDYMQHIVKAKHREARISGTMIDQNYNLLELLQQGDVANQYLNSISIELTEANKHLVDLNHLVGDFMDVVEAGFENVVSSLNRVSNELALTRAALIAELRHVEQTVLNIGNTLLREQKYANVLLQRLVWLEENSHINDSIQYFKDGLKCLMNAETPADIEDAYAAFDDGTKVVRSSVENQYGAGLAAELLGNFKDAAERYGKAVRRSKDEMPEAASISYEGLARVAQKQNNLRTACEYAAKAFEINPNNLIALYEYSRYLALMGRLDKSIENLVELITQEEKYLIRMNLDSEFQQLEVQRLYEELWDKQLVKNPIGLRQLLTNFLLFNDIDRAFSVFRFLVDFHPQSLFNPYFWLPQLFNKIEALAKEYFRQLLSKGISSGNQRYAKTLLLLRLDFSSEDLLTAFLSELEDDPAYYEKDVEKIHRHLAANPPNEVEKLIEKILPLLPEEYNWLKLEEYTHV